MEAHHWAAIAKSLPDKHTADPWVQVMGQCRIPPERHIVLFYHTLEENYTLYTQRSMMDYSAAPYDPEDHWTTEEIVDDFLNVCARELEVQRIMNRGLPG